MSMTLIDPKTKFVSVSTVRRLNHFLFLQSRKHNPLGHASIPSMPSQPTFAERPKISDLEKLISTEIRPKKKKKKSNPLNNPPLILLYSRGKIKARSSHSSKKSKRKRSTIETKSTSLVKKFASRSAWHSKWPMDANYPS